MNVIMEKLKNNRQSVLCLFYPIIKEKSLSVAEILSDSEKQAELLVEIAKKYPVGAVVRMAELWCEAAAFGMKCEIKEDDFPKLGEPLFSEAEELEEVQIPSLDCDVLRPMIEAVRLAVPQMEKPLIVGVTGPYTLGSVLNGSEDFMMNCLMDPDAVGDFLEKITNFLIKYISAYKVAGACAVMIAEPSTAMISPAMMEEFSNTYLEKIVNELQDDKFSIVYHNCGIVNAHLETIAELPVDGFHFGSDVDLAKALELIESGKLVMGNVDPRHFMGVSVSRIEQSVYSLMDKFSFVENWRLSTGCDLSPSASMKGIQAFLTVCSF